MKKKLRYYEIEHINNLCQVALVINRKEYFKYFENEKSNKKQKRVKRGSSEMEFGNKKLVLKNNAPFISCISKINNTFTYTSEDFDVIMLMYNLLESSKIYTKTEKFYSEEKVELKANNLKKISTNIRWKIPKNHYGRICPCSQVLG